MVPGERIDTIWTLKIERENERRREREGKKTKRK